MALLVSPLTASAMMASPRLKSLMSTMAGKHGHEHSKTEVPRTTLVNALKSETDFFTTQLLDHRSDHKDFFEDTELTF